MSLGVGSSTRPPDYFVSRTVLRESEYGAAGMPIVQRLGFDERDYSRTGGVHLLRCTVMDPFFAERRGTTDLLAGFLETISTVLEREMPERANNARELRIAR